MRKKNENKRKTSILILLMYLLSSVSVHASAEDVGKAFNYNTIVNAESEIDIASNRVANGNFSEYLNGWTRTGDIDAVNSSWNNDREGFVLNYWSTSKYKADTYQQITGLENGKYKMSVFVNSGGFNELYIYAQDTGYNKVTKNISPSVPFTKITLEFEVNNGQAVIGFYGDGKAGAWANFDDVEVVKCDEEPASGELVNSEFENGLEGWDYTGTNNVVSWNPELGNANTKGYLSLGSYNISEDAYETDVYQTIKGLENGTYTVSAYSSSSGQQDELYMYAKGFDSASTEKLIKENITETYNFRLTLLEVEVTNNEITIGFHAKGGKNEWAAFDSVEITKKEDTRSDLKVIKNFSFNDSLNGWNIAGDSKAVAVDKTSGYNDGTSLRFKYSKNYKVRCEQTINGLENGSYKFEFYAKSSGGQNRVYGYASNFGKSEAKTSIPVDSSFKKVVVDFEVTNNKATIGFYSDSPKNVWTNVDNVKLYKVEEGYTMLKGGDLTEINYVEAAGGVFYDENGEARDPFHILAENGFNFARLRVYNKTGRDSGHKYEDGSEYYLPDGYQDKEDMLNLAKRAKDVNMKIELSLHYSDWWSNGVTQDIPSEWNEMIKGKSKEEAIDILEEMVYEYTKDIMMSMKEQDTIPEYISLGNEMQAGILYPYGTVENMETLARFLNAGSRAVREVNKNTKIVLHLDEAGDNNRYYTLLDGCEEYEVDYDIIGPSYYPFWTRNTVEQIIPWCNSIYKRYNKKILFMETGYNWNPTTIWGTPGQLVDNGNESHASSPQGQKEFMDELFNGIRNADGNSILGALYWDPVMINNNNVGWAILKGDAEDGSNDAVGNNVVSNTTLFDFTGKALKSLKSFSDSTEGSAYGAISGKVIDNNGKAVEGADVKVVVNGKEYKRTTDKYGKFFLNQLAECSNTSVEVSKNEYKRSIKEVTISPGNVTTMLNTI